VAKHPETKPDQEIQNWLKLAAFVKRNRDIQLGGIVVLVYPYTWISCCFEMRSLHPRRKSLVAKYLTECLSATARGLLNKSAELQLIGPLSAATVRDTLLSRPLGYVGPTRLVPLDQNWDANLPLQQADRHQPRPLVKPTDTDDPQKDQINYRQYLPLR